MAELINRTTAIINYLESLNLLPGEATTIHIPRKELNQGVLGTIVPIKLEEQGKPDIYQFDITDGMLHEEGPDDIIEVPVKMRAAVSQ